MELRKASFADVAGLAWTASLAFATASGSWPRLRAVLGYPRHLFCLTLHAANGVLWHSKRRLAITIDPRAKGARPSHIAALAIGLLSVACLQPLFWLEPSNRTEATLQLAVLAGILLLMIGFLITLLVALVRTRPVRYFKASRAIRLRAQDEQSPMYDVGYLAKHPDEAPGESFRFAKAAIAAAVPPGGVMCTIAWTDRHIRAYQAVGFTQLSLNGKPTAGLICAAPERVTHIRR